MRPSPLFLTAFCLALLAAQADETKPTPLGLYGQIRDLVLPGSELEARPLEQESPVVLRIVTTRPHGDAFRYDFDYYGLEGGAFDLRDFLQRIDGGDAADLPPIPVRFDTVLDATRLKPNPPTGAELPKVGGYRNALIAGTVLWVLGMLALIFYKRPKAPAAPDADTAPLTFADKLRPLLESASAGELDKAQQAQLERSLLGFWRDKLDLSDESPATALIKLRKHDEAGALLRQLEAWLHAPQQQKPTDLDALLAPYRQIAAPDS